MIKVKIIYMGSAADPAFLSCYFAKDIGNFKFQKFCIIMSLSYKTWGGV